jgi:uncharacterized membrane protein
MGSLPWILAGIFAGGVLHILCVFSVPWLAENDAWTRLSANLKPNALVIAEETGPLRLPFTSPDVITAYCLYDLSEHGLVVRAPLIDGTWSLAVSSRSGENFYLVTGADAKKPEVQLLIIRRDRLSEEASTEKTEEGDDQNIIVSPTQRGLIAMRAPLRGESFRSQTMEQLRKARCESQKTAEPIVASVSETAAEPGTPSEEARRRYRRRRRR